MNHFSPIAIFAVGNPSHLPRPSPWTTSPTIGGKSTRGSAPLRRSSSRSHRLSSRKAPSGISPSMMCSIRIRFSFLTPCPHASTIRRICLFFPSVRMMRKVSELTLRISQGCVWTNLVLFFQVQSSKFTVQNCGFLTRSVRLPLL